MMGNTPKTLAALWKRNSELREKAIAGKLSPSEFRSLPPQLRLPVKLRGWPRPPKGLHGPAVVEWLRGLGAVWQDTRFDDCINALFEHGIVDAGTPERAGTYKISRQNPEVDRSNEYMRAKCLEEFRARHEQIGSQLRASLEVAAEWALGRSLEAGAKWLRDNAPPEE
jgi:hypothetical protein